jgi:DNA-binding transcriptional MerR regulator
MSSENNSEQIEITYTTQRIANTVGIGKSTLNKYTRSLEKSGYVFYKDDSGKRAYTEHDVVALRHLKELLEKDISYDDAIRSISIKYTRELKTGSDVALPTTQYDERYFKLEEKVDEQTELIKQLVRTIDERDKKRDEILMATLREIQEGKKQLALAKEQKNKWWKLWK